MSPIGHLEKNLSYTNSESLLFGPLVTILKWFPYVGDPLGYHVPKNGNGFEGLLGQKNQYS